MRHLNKYYPFDESNFREFFESEYKIRLNNIGLDGAVRLFEAFSLLPKRLLTDLIDTIDIDASLGTPMEYFPNHGRWDAESDTMYLNPKVLEQPEDPKHLILHEIGHAIDHELGMVSMKKTWRALSGWTQKPEGITFAQRSNRDYVEHGDYERLKIEEDSRMAMSHWWHLKSAAFVRFYAARSPKEDLAESFAYYVMGETSRFEDCPEKAKFVKTNILTHKKERGEQ